MPQKGKKSIGSGIYEKSELHKRKISESLKRKGIKPKVIFRGSKDDISWREKQSESHKGKKYPSRKRPLLTEEHKRKISASHKGKHSKERCNFWKGGISYEPYTIDWTETLKRAIRERDHYLCKICGQYGNHVHHIDYNKENCNPENLVTVCMSCHARTNFNRDFWINYFQEV